MKRYFGVICVFVFLASLCLIAGPAMAQDDFQERIQNQQQRINKGIQAGALTKEEASTLQANLDYVRDTFARQKADGRLTLEEQRRLDRILDENSNMIRQEKHDSNVKGVQGIVIRRLF